MDVLRKNFDALLPPLSFHEDFHAVVPDQLPKNFTAINLSTDNAALTEQYYSSLQGLQQFIDDQFAKAGTQYLVGGFAENRNLYLRSNLFNDKISANFNTEEARSLHLGVDIWGAAGTPVMAPLGGIIHSFADNNHLGDYGPTIILQHQIDGISFYTLYGHLTRASLKQMRVGKIIVRGEVFTHFGNAEENGQWPPHLHFQVLWDMETMEGDYPGVCKPSEQDKFLANCIDPEYILRLKKI